MTKTFDSNHAPVFPQGVFIIGTYDKNGIPNAMNAAWGFQSDYGEITFSLAKHKTTENLKETGGFTVAFGTVDTMEICDYFGIESGNKVNKIEAAGVHVHKAPNVNAPVIEEFPVIMECRVKSWNEETGILIGEIVDEIVDEKYLDEEGKIDFGKVNPIIFDIATGAYRSTGPVVGKAFKAGIRYRK